jgi:hypothetical protein
MAPRVRKTVAPPSEPPQPVADYRFDAARKNIPPAGLAAQGKLAEPRRASATPAIRTVIRGA